jgi:hypothetical protein
VLIISEADCPDLSLRTKVITLLSEANFVIRLPSTIDISRGFNGVIFCY